MAANALQLQRPSAVTLLAVVEWSAAGSNPIKRMRLCVAGTRAYTLTPDGRQYQPKIALVTPISRDADGTGSFELTVVNRTGVVVEEYGPGYAYSSHATFADAIQRFPQILSSGRVRLYVEGVAPSGDVTVHQVLDARVVGVVNACAMSITLRAEVASGLDDVVIPAMTVSESLFAPSSSIRLCAEAAGEPSQVVSGSCAVVPGSWAMPDDLKYLGGIFGWEIPTVPVQPYARVSASHGEYLRSIVGEYATGHSDMAGIAAQRSAAYVDVVGGRMASIYCGFPTSPGTWSPAGQSLSFGSYTAGPKPFVYAQTRKHPVVQVPAVLEAVEDSTGQVSRMIDGDPTTYGSVDPGATVTIAIGKQDAVGRICLNTTDQGDNALYDLEGSGYPVGLKVLVLLAYPVGGDAPSSPYTVEVAYRYPGDPYGAPFLSSGVYATIHDVAVPLSQGTASWGYVNVPVKRPVGGGWLGTRWHEWDFVAGTSDDPSNPDYPIYPFSDEDYVGKPMRITVKNNMTTKAYVAAVAFVVGCFLHREARTAVVRRYLKRDKYGRLRSSAKEIKTDSGHGPMVDPWTRLLDSGIETESPDFVANGRNAYARDPVLRRSQIVQLENRLAGSRMIKEIAVAATTLRDVTASGDYAGLYGQSIDHPIPLSRYMLQAYGGVPSSAIRTGPGVFGSYSVARVFPRYFLGSGTVDTCGPMAAWCQEDQAPLAAAIAGVLRYATCGTEVRQLTDGTWGWFPWCPKVAADSGRVYSETPLDVKRVIAAAPDGSPDVDHSMGQWAEVVNQVEVVYSGRARKVARCWRDGSTWKTDDGTGASWNGGIVPYSAGMGIDELCAMSADRYGLRPPLRVEMPGFVDRFAAVTEGMYVLCRRWLPPITLRMGALLPLYDMQPGHLFRLSDDLATEYGVKPLFWGDGAKWDSIWWECVSNTFDATTGTHEIEARWIPYYIGDVTRAGIWGGIEDEVVL